MSARGAQATGTFCRSPSRYLLGSCFWDIHANHHGGLQLARAIRNSLVRGIDDDVVAVPWLIFTRENLFPRRETQPVGPREARNSVHSCSGTIQKRPSQLLLRRKRLGILLR